MKRKGIFQWTGEDTLRRLTILFALSLVLSLSGYIWQSASESGSSAIEGFFRAISHFTLNSLDEQLPCGLGAKILVILGRLLAVLFFVLTTASLLQSVFHWKDRWFLWQHFRSGEKYSVLIGLGWKGRNLLANRQVDEFPCFVIESSTTAKVAQSPGNANVLLLHGDATDEQILRKVKPEKADCIYICTGKDETNIQVVQEMSLLGFRKNAVVCVDLKSQRKFDVLKRSIPRHSEIDLRLFNTEAITMRLLLEKHPLDRFESKDGKLGAEIIVLGECSMARELIRQVMQHGVFELGRKLHITWLVDDAKKTCKSFTGQYPCFKEVRHKDKQWIAKPEDIWSYDSKGASVLPEITFRNLPASERGVLEVFEEQGFLREGSWATSVFCVFDDSARSAVQACVLAPALKARGPDKDISLCFYFNTRENHHREEVEKSLQPEEKSRQHGFAFYTFSDFLGKCSMASARGDALDKTSRRVNGIYQMGQFVDWLKNPTHANPHPEWATEAVSMNLPRLVQQCKADTDPLRLLQAFDSFCYGIWNQCPENDKESNRQAAAHAHVKKRIRARICQSGLEAEMTLAKIEHRRWCVEYLLRGFRPLTRIPSDPSTVQPFELKVEEKKDMLSWFGQDGVPGKKSEFKAVKRHVDLVPFEDFKVLFEEARADKEEGKDLDQIRALDLMLRP